MWYICAVICQRRSPFGSRSMFDRFPLVLRYSFVRPSFVLRSVSVREARCNGDVTDKEKIRNKPEYKSQRSLICCVTKLRHHHSKCRKNLKFAQGKYEITKSYDMTLRHRINAIMSRLKSTQSLQLTFITTFGVNYNMYSGIVQSEITLDELFV